VGLADLDQVIAEETVRTRDGLNDNALMGFLDRPEALVEQIRIGAGMAVDALVSATLPKRMCDDPAWEEERRQILDGYLRVTPEPAWPTRGPARSLLLVPQGTGKRWQKLLHDRSGMHGNVAEAEDSDFFAVVAMRML